MNSQPIQLLLALSLAATPVLAQTPSNEPATQVPLAQAHLMRMAETYGAAAWAQGERRAGIPNRPSVQGYEIASFRAEDGLVTRTYRSTVQGAPRAAFVVESQVFDDAVGAHGFLLDHLAGLQSPTPAPPASDVGASVGDVSYAGRSGAHPGALAWVAFTRGNVAVRVFAFDARKTPNLDLASVVGELDASIVAGAALAQDATLPAPSIATLSAARAQLPAGERVRLDVAVQDAQAGKAHLGWKVIGPGQGYVEADDEGVLWLYTTAPGAIELRLEATGSHGVAVTRSVAVTVEEEV